MKCIAIMKGNHIIYGEFDYEKVEFEPYDDKMIKSLKNVVDFNDYKKFSECFNILGLNLTQKSVKDYLNKLNVREIYFYDPKPNIETCTIKDFKDYWFKYINYDCIECINKCKQSSRVKVIKCKDFKGK